MKRATLILFAILCMASRHPDRMIRSDLALNVSFNRGDASDRSINSKNGTLTSGAVVTAGNRYLTLDGTDDFVNHGDADAFSFTSGGQDQPFSVSAWVYLTASSATPKSIVSKIESVSPARVEWAFYTSSNSVPYNGPSLTMFHSDASKSIVGAVVSNIIPATTWTHVVCTYSGSESANGIKIYMGGVDVTNYRVTDAGYTGMSNTSASVNVGRRELSGLHLGGNMDDVRIYNRELSAAEVAAITSSGRE